MNPLDDLIPRLRATRAELDDALELVTAARTRRNALIVEGYENGLPHAALADAAGIKRPVVYEIILRAQADKLAG